MARRKVFFTVRYPPRTARALHGQGLQLPRLCRISVGKAASVTTIPDMSSCSFTACMGVGDHILVTRNIPSLLLFGRQMESRAKVFPYYEADSRYGKGDDAR